MGWSGCKSIQSVSAMHGNIAGKLSDSQTLENCTGPNEEHTSISDVLTMVFVTVVVVVLLLFK